MLRKTLFTLSLLFVGAVASVPFFLNHPWVSQRVLHQMEEAAASEDLALQVGELRCTWSEGLSLRDVKVAGAYPVEVSCIQVRVTPSILWSWLCGEPRYSCALSGLQVSGSEVSQEFLDGWWFTPEKSAGGYSVHVEHRDGLHGLVRLHTEGRNLHGKVFLGLGKESLGELQGHLNLSFGSWRLAGRLESTQMWPGCSWVADVHLHGRCLRWFTQSSLSIAPLGSKGGLPLTLHLDGEGHTTKCRIRSLELLSEEAQGQGWAALNWSGVHPWLDIEMDCTVDCWEGLSWLPGLMDAVDLPSTSGHLSVCGRQGQMQWWGRYQQRDQTTGTPCVRALSGSAPMGGELWSLLAQEWKEVIHVALGGATEQQAAHSS